MAEKFDVASRLGEGRGAVDDLQNYVSACQLLGYRNADLTLHASQVRDWYDSDDGLDLEALDADCAAFEAAAAATDDARARQDSSLAAMAAAWQGRGAEASREFLRRHGEAGAAAAASIRTAADALAALRDNLWHAVDAKVAATVSTADRVADRRADWLAAAQVVTTSTGDRAAASELIDQEVKPFADNAIRSDWLTAMRTAMAAATDSYDTATAELTSEPAAVFDVPGEMGPSPSWTPPPVSDYAATTQAEFPGSRASSFDDGFASPPPGPLPTWSVPPSPPLDASPRPPAPPSPTPAPPLDPSVPAPAVPSPPSMPSLGGTPDLGSGVSGFGQQLADTLGGLLGSAEGIDELPELDEQPPDDDENDDLDEETDDADDETEDGDDVEDPAGVTDACADAAAEPPPVEAADPPLPVEPLVAAPEPAPTAAPLPAPPDPVAEPVAAETPCEIAADELPQVGQ